jgi:type II secretion system protein H
MLTEHGQGKALSSHPGRENGFTLIELIIVLFIIGLISSLVVPRIMETGKSAARSDAKRIGLTLRYIYGESIARKIPYTLIIDIDRGIWRYESKAESKNFSLRRRVMISDVITPSMGKVTSGEVRVSFEPAGPSEPMTIHLSGGESEFTVIFNHLNGRAKVYEGYKV